MYVCDDDDGLMFLIKLGKFKERLLDFEGAFQFRADQSGFFSCFNELLIDNMYK